MSSVQNMLQQPVVVFCLSSSLYGERLLLTICTGGCRYYNWRQDTYSDLLLVTAMSVLLLWSAALLKNSYIDQRGEVQAPPISTPAETLLQTTTVQPAASADVAVGLGFPFAPGLQTAPTPANILPAATAAAGRDVSGSVVTTATAGSSSGGGGVAGYLLSLWQDIYQVLVLSFGENFPQAHGKGPWYAARDLPPLI